MYSNVTSKTQVSNGSDAAGALLGAERSGLAPASSGTIPAMGNLGLYFVFLIPPLIIGFWIQHRLKKTVGAQMQVAVANGMSRRAGRADDPRPQRPRGRPRATRRPAARSPTTTTRGNRTVNLSQGVYDGHAVASVAIAAHEVGHAIQHEKAYAPFKVRSAMSPGRRLRVERLVHPAHDRRLRPDLRPRRSSRSSCSRSSCCSSS